MHEIFISYSSRHRDLTRTLAAAIENQYGPQSVWWDHELEARSGYATQIRAALEASRVVVVVWTADALVSDYVYAEAVRAHQTHKLVNVRPTDTGFAQIPEPFNIHHIEDLASTGRILRAIASAMAGRPLPTRVPLHELYWRQHGQRLLDVKQDTLPAALLDISPSQLLQAKYEQVAYLDATGQRAALLDWALRHPRRAAGRLLHGPGGIGKTRLLVEVASALRSQGWAAGFVEGPPPNAGETARAQWQQALEQIIALGEEPGLLLVLDYAEGRQGDVLELAGWLGSRPVEDPRLLRLVLLARSAGDWWERLRDEHLPMQQLFADRSGWPGVLSLPPFESPEQRTALFDASCAAYAPVFQAQDVHPPSADLPASLRDAVAEGPDHRRPLAIQMAALVWLAGSPGADGGPGIAGLLDQVLGLERRHWEQLLGKLDNAARTALERGLAQVTLVRGAPTHEAAESLLMHDGHYLGRRTAPVDAASVLDQLERLYGHSAGGLVPLEPDLVGEHLVAKVGDGPLLDGCITWIARGTGPGDLAPESADKLAAARRGLVTVLQRATQREHGPRVSADACRLVDRLILLHLVRWADPVVTTLVATPGEMLNRLDQALPALPIEALEVLDRALPARSLTLDAFALRVAELRLVMAHAEHAAAAKIDPVVQQTKLARCYGTLGFRLAAVGRREDALAALDRGVQTYRQLEHSCPNGFLPELATSLNNMGNGLSDLGRCEDALAAFVEALQIFRRLAENRESAFLPDLAMVLGNQGRILPELGRCEEALAATEEALMMHRCLAAFHPEEFLPRLAMGLTNLGLRLSDLFRHEEALAAADEGLQIYRRLAESRPDAFLPDLACSLTNQTLPLLDLGRLEEALAVTEEALQIHRRLAERIPDAFLPSLAMSLGARSDVLAGTGRYREAAAAAAEGLEVLMPIIERHADPFRNVASSLARHHIRYCEIAQQSPDAVLLTEVVRHLGPIATDPDLPGDERRPGYGRAGS
jgi:tetratricopeptide (TPR) repeat protein